MSSNEEYLDNLLKSMDGNSGSQGADSVEEMDDEDIDALFAAAERILNGELSEDEPEETGGYETGTAVEASAAEPEEEEAKQEPSKESVEKAASADVEEAQEAYPTMESAKDMTQEEIEALLASTENQPEEEAGEDEPENTEDTVEQDDLMALLGESDSNGDLSAIGDLLEAADSGELPADTENTDAKGSDAEEPEAFFPDIAFPAEMEEEPAEDTEDTEDDGKKKKRERKPKKEKKVKEKKVKEKKEKKTKTKSAEAADDTTAEGESAATDGMVEPTEKKKGFFSKLLTALTEEEESNISDENQAIMQELEEEDLKEAGKKKKMKKGKKPADGKGKDEADEDEEDIGKGKKKGKPKKEPKPKKQKEPKEPAVPEKPGKRISPKSIVVVVLFAATVFGGIFLSISLFSGELRMQSATDAFERGDYMTCYEEMYGMDLNEEEKMMFRHAEIVLKMQRRITTYEKYIGEGRELEALDSLMQAVADYDDMYTKAQECGAGVEVAGLYDRIIQVLQDNYGVGQDAARAIALCPSNVDYTRYLTALIAGEGISTGGEQGGISLPEEELQDLLPAEEELNRPGFAD